MRKLTKTLSFLAAWPLVVALLLGSIIAVAFTPAIYFYEYKQLGQAQVIGCDEGTLQTITTGLIDYMKGDRGNLDIPAVINGESRYTFNDREKAHMADVKYLFDMARYVAAVCLIAGAMLLTFALSAAAPGFRAQDVSGYLLWGILSVVVLLGALAAYFAIDFNRAWTHFHQVFFANDLWLLDPKTDVLIMMMPLPFFMHILTYIAVLFGSGLLIIALIAAIVRVRAAGRAANAIIDIPDEHPLGAVEAADGERFVLRDGDGERPDAEDIFEQFGLSDEDDQPLLPEQDSPQWNEERPHKAVQEELPTQVPPAQPEVEPQTVRTVEEGGLSVSVPVSIPASALDITRLKDGVKLELKLELFLRDDGTLLAPPPKEEREDVSAPPPVPEDPVTRDEPTMQELMSRMDEIMAGLPTEEKEESND